MPQGRRKRKKVPRTAACASASPQHFKDFPVASEGKNVKGAVPHQEDGIYRREGFENVTQVQGKKGKNSTVLHFFVESTPC